MAFQAHDMQTLNAVLKQNNSVAILFNDGSIIMNFAMEPEFDLMSTQSNDIFFVKVNLEEVPEAQELATQKGLATVNLYEQGSLIQSIPGYNLELIKGALLRNVV
ncbi:hypothetical protein DSO57_1028441 [Entomophthora muscae]|uniref:Uncharacterized protein n=1 Tax=Entomophthora muscae TaxID=34485 RepID=A0ACC2SE31_9FUNG|nr:hypothetical protein DSO57_1028441 [Entomophthora muscae]